jgi:hypothetical protein
MTQTPEQEPTLGEILNKIDKQQPKIVKINSMLRSTDKTDYIT